jgi:hypothetical protein
VVETSGLHLPAGIAGIGLVLLLIAASTGGRQGVGGFIRLLGVGALIYVLLSRVGVVTGLGHLLVFILIFGAFYVMLRPLLQREGPR